MMEPIKKLSKFKIPVQKKSLVPEYRIHFSRAIDVIGFLQIHQRELFMEVRIKMTNFTNWHLAHEIFRILPVFHSRRF